MKVNFRKYQGTGNDFVIIDDRDHRFPDKRLDLITNICDRKFGVGADGVILIRNHAEFDFEMIYFNSDGSKSFCGNGTRCAVSDCYSLGMIKRTTKFLSTDGIHEAEILENGIVRLLMHNVDKVETNGDDFIIDTGSPHYVTNVERLSDLDVVKSGREIRYSERFSKNGINVNFVEQCGNIVSIRTYERGVENETLSCGTGATAVALSFSIGIGLESPVKVIVQGGELAVEFEKLDQNRFRNIYLSGPAEFVFEGQITL